MKRTSSLIVVLVFLILCSCDLFKDDSPYSGITVTTLVEVGEGLDPDEIIISEDEDDWNIKIEPPLPTSTSTPLILHVGPAFPNPCTDSTYIAVDFPDKYLLNIYIKDKNGEKIRTLYYDTLTAGRYYFHWLLDDNNSNRVNNGMYRCYYTYNYKRYESHFDTVGVIHKVSGYGDIKVE